jgi:hypothetical protein
MSYLGIVLLALVIVPGGIIHPSRAESETMNPIDPLPSWNDTAPKRAILDFVARTTKPGGADFVPSPERVAVFDNDGTLWPENPVPFQLSFAFDRLKQDLPAHPEWKDDPFVQATLSGDLAMLVADHYKGLFHVIGLTHAGMTTEEFATRVNDWMATARHPRFGRSYDACLYQPMREVLAHLRANGYRTFIVSGGGADFMRAWAERVYGVMPEQVVGSHGAMKFEMRDGRPVLVKTLEMVFIDDKEGKPAGIHEIIGRRPVMAFGNSDGDKAMLEYTTIGNPRPSFGLIVHHTDAVREYAYDAAPKSSGKLVEALADAPGRGWTVVDMARDWNTVLADDSITAIDVLLEPDAAMLERAGAVNARLLGVWPKGFALDDSHRPHITLVQRFVRTADLARCYEALNAVMARSEPTGLKLEGIRHYYIPDGNLGAAGIVVESTPELRALHGDVVEAVSPFCVPTGGSSAFVTTPDDLVISPSLVAYVSGFVPNASGEHFNPHVTTGMAPREFLDGMLDEPFDRFSFGVVSAAVYQLGQFGTAAKRLKALGAGGR